MNDLLALAVKNIGESVSLALEQRQDQPSLVLYDDAAPLTRLLVDAYRQVLPHGEFVRVSDTAPDKIRERFQALPTGSLVVLVQSANFRLNEFRVRIELFARGLKTIEHMHLERLSQDQWSTYVESLAYDPTYLRPLGRTLKERLDKARTIAVACGTSRLTVMGPFEPAKLNVGDYAGLSNIGGTYPIGEVFTESTSLFATQGDLAIFGFAAKDHVIQIHEPPFSAHVEDGILSAPKAPPEFQEVLDMIRADERVLVREVGFGLNPAMDRQRVVNDVTAYERMTGLHLSLGEKHGVFKKPGLVPGKTRYHVDIFVAAERILIDDEVVFEDGHYTLCIPSHH